MIYSPQTHGTLISFGLAASSFLSSPCLSPAFADTPGQTQQSLQALCSRAAASYERRDLAGVEAVYVPNFTVRSVVGKTFSFRQTQANLAAVFAKNNHTTLAYCSVSGVVVQGNHAQATLHWHYVSRYTRPSSKLAFTVTRDYEEHSLWKKQPGGWKETSADMTQDVDEYKR